MLWTRYNSGNSLTKTRKEMLIDGIEGLLCDVPLIEFSETLYLGLKSLSVQVLQELWEHVDKVTTGKIPAKS